MTCGVCGSPATLAEAAHHGYQLPATYAIYRCDGCGTSFADPCRAEGALYEAIYRAPERVIGYDRYARYAKGVLKVRDPLRYLADEDDIYHAIAAGLRRHASPGARVLDLGCGMGYLTYALGTAGYDATGADISAVAIAAASERYGPARFVHRSAQEMAGRGERYEAVVMAETIEHLEEPLSALRAALDLLMPGGALVLTTPNRSAFAPEVVWPTDPPPIHLWWFTEDGVRRMAADAGATATFVSFARYNARHPLPRAGSFFAPVSTQPVLDESGEPIPRGGAKRARNLLWRAGLRPAVRKAWELRVHVANRGLPHPQRRPTMGVVLKRDAQG